MIPRNFLASVAIAFATITPANSQSSSTAAGPPLTQEDLIRRLDKLGTGDPAKQQPASVDDFPKPLREPKPVKKDKGPTEITASEATFDQKTHQATFAVKVVVKDPEFNVTCDRLTALLKSDKPKVATSGAKPATPVACWA